MNREGHALKSVETATKDMTEQSYEYLGPGIKAWTKGVPVEDEALQQLRNVAGLPFIHKHVAGTVRLKFWALSNRLIVAGNHRISARFMGSRESHFQPNCR